MPLVVKLDSARASLKNAPWTTAGSKTLNVRATNAAGATHRTHTIVIGNQANSTSSIYLSTVLR